MRKRTIPYLLLTLTSISAAASVYAASPAETETAKYTEKAVPLILDGEETAEPVLRFYEETPNVPYMGMSEFAGYMDRGPFTAESQEDGTVVLKNSIGAELRCDPDAGIITVEDWNAFFDMPLPLEHEAIGWKDSTVPYSRITAVEFEGEPETVELDMAGYGIGVYADSDDIYLPVSTLSNIMTDIATNHMIYNGEKLYAQRVDMELKPIEGFWESKIYEEEFKGAERPEDIIMQCYADLCFNVDHFFGYPGVAPLDEEMAEKGLDQALAELGEEGEELKEGLLSPDIYEYTAAMSKLFYRYLSDGHTVFISGSELSTVPSFIDGHTLEFITGAVFDILHSRMTLQSVANMRIPNERNECWGDDNYREYGNTAVIRVDGFMPDEKGWTDYYNHEGDMPEDCFGIVVSGLNRASENPDIKNVIFDLTCNGGGSPDPMMAILAVTTGQDRLYGIHRITGRKMTFTFETDANFDGVFDEKDREVRYNFNYGVMTTRYAFSCGNLFPIIAQEGGMAVIGEPTSGGSCCIQIGTDAQGFRYTMSSGQWQLTDSAGGCSVDMPIRAKSHQIINIAASLIGIDDGFASFESYYDDEMLDEMMNEWFAQEEMESAA
ncbi:MAG: S41 family peptidase [Lachnospiraceae bacterium]|nr:S41 family peptidase [Lachnospiraceae bacterium]